MDAETERRTQDLFEALDGALAERLDATAVRSTSAFLRLYYAGASPDYLLADEPLDLLGAALDHLRLADLRQPGEPRLRVYDPDLERDGWQSTHTVVLAVTDDMPFLVDSLTAAVNHEGLAIHVLVHPILHVRRDAAGRLLETSATDATPAESFIRLEIDRLAEPERLAALAKRLTGVLIDVARAVRDWPAMVERIEEAIADLAPRFADRADDGAEVVAFLRWLAADHFTFLGYGRYRLSEGADGLALDREPGHGLGILDGPTVPGVSTFAQLPAEVRAAAADPADPLILTKGNSRSTVHRAAHLDYVGVKRYGADGRVVGEHRFLGLYTAAAYNRTPSDIPLLRGKVARLIAAAGVRPASHDGKALLNIIETYPRDELFQADEATLGRTMTDILHLQYRQRLRLFVRYDPYGRFATCLVFVPRDRYTTEVRQRFEAALMGALGGVDVEFDTRLGESILARVLFTVRTRTAVRDVDVEALEKRLVELARSWSDGLLDALIEALGEGEGHRLYRRFAAGLPAGYQETVAPRLAVRDLVHLDRLADGTSTLDLNLYRPVQPGTDTLRFKVFRADDKLPLATILPILANMGLTVIDEQPYLIRDGAGRAFWLHDFGMVVSRGIAQDLERVRDRFQATFAAIWRGEVESDGFNRLVLLAGLDVRQVQVLRVYCRYLLQIKLPFSQAYVEDTLAQHPPIAEALVALFETRFDPAFTGDRAAATDGLAAEIGRLLEGVAVRDEDLIVRSYREVILATLRTNAYQRLPAGERKPYLSIKLDPRAIRLMPQPRPAYEIFVHAVRFEGVHLRAGKVARGGLRWSDRREDFRTEVLGLMKAQQVKNGIIVPVGAKGGFVLKRPPDGDRTALQAEGIACYRAFLSGLLDLTDNRVGDAIVPPPDVIRYDDDDPYLVVAADKGTATFSDIANEVAASYGFWLGDAFASGGSAGYDHKGMGITARGAWESTRRHFRELGRDCQTQPFTCVGIGDMSGDVFGNGMLLSRQTKLVAAFDHRHIFVDPDPDPATSHAERERLFRLPTSSWDDYDRTRLSRGGGIWPRTAKSIQLSPDARRALGITDTALAPTDLIRAILMAPVDLLWNGGIGTYVKASTERHADAEDRANDAVRVDADRLRCKVVVEGGNLGLTQRARVELALRGVRLNTDFIDNSAGVDCSDHEVNIKILLNGVVAAGDLTVKQRDALLASMTDEVAELCIRDNVLQNLALSLAEAMPVDHVDAQMGLIRRLEAEAGLDRGLALLPTDEAMQERRMAGHGLTRPEMAVLLAHTKNALYDRLLASSVVDEPYLGSDLTKYFPRPLRRRFSEAIAGHRLRREIIATWLANSLVNRGLDVFAFDLVEATGRELDEVARAYVVARDAFGLLPLWSAIEGLDRVPAAEQTRLLGRARTAIVDGTVWFLAHQEPAGNLTAAVQRFATGIDEVVTALPATLPASPAKQLADEARRLVDAGLAADLAHRLAALPYLIAACDIIEVGRDSGTPLADAAEAYFALATALDLDRTRGALASVAINSRWDRLTANGLADDLNDGLRRLTARVLAGGGPSQAAVQAWLDRTAVQRQRYGQLAAEIEAAPTPNLAMLGVAVRALRDLANR